MPSDGVFVAQARALVKDLFEPRPLIYWTDLVLSVAIAYAAFYLAHRRDLQAWVRLGCFVLSGLAFYRAVLFIHELVHLNGSELRAFRFVWNALLGIPLLVPTFLYYTHLEHHRPKHYGTHEDGEYLPLGRGPVVGIVLFLLTGLGVPALAVLRFLVLTPASWASRSARALIHRYASAMVIDPSYARPVPRRRNGGSGGSRKSSAWSTCWRSPRPWRRGRSAGPGSSRLTRWRSSS